MSTIIPDPATLPSAGGDDDDMRLASIFRHSRETLQFFVQHAEQLYPPPLADSASLEVMKRAWLEVELLFNDLIAPDQWDEQQRTALSREGLSGEQLRFKAAVFTYLYAQFLESRHQLLESQAVRRRRGRGIGRRRMSAMQGPGSRRDPWFFRFFQKEEGVLGPAFGWARNILKYINTILESAKVAFPPIGAIKEFKEAQEVLLESKKLVEEQLG